MDRYHQPFSFQRWTAKWREGTEPPWTSSQKCQD